MNYIKYFSLVGRILLCLSLLLLFGRESFTANKKEDIIIGTTNEFDSIHPLAYVGGTSSYIIHMTNRALVYTDYKGDLIPGIATEIPSFSNKQVLFDNKTGGMKVIWKIRPEAKWGDGTLVTCADLDFAREVGSSENVGVVEREPFTSVTKIEYKDSKSQECIFHYSKQIREYSRLNNFFALPAHLEKKKFEENKKTPSQYERISSYTSAFTNPGLYNGPFIVSEIKQGSHVTLMQNPNFFGTKPKLKKVIIKVVPNSATMKAQLITGQIDFISWMGGIGLELAADIEKQNERNSDRTNDKNSEKFKLKVISATMNNFDFLCFNLDNPIISDGEVRRALNLAIDRNEINNSFFLGKARPADQVVGPADPWYVESAELKASIIPDKKMARTILDKRGWKLDEKDKYRYKEGKRLSIVITAAAGNKLRETIEVFLQAVWKDIGVELIIKNVPPRVLFGEVLKNRKFEGITYFGTGFGPEESRRQYFHSESIPSEKNSWSGRNYMGWKNAKSDQIWDKMSSTFDFKERQVLAKEFVLEVNKDLPVLPIIYRTEVVATRSDLKGFRINVAGLYDSIEIENWYFE